MDETTETPNNPQDSLNFLMEVLQKVSENPNPQLIYPFLTQNMDKLDDNFIKVLDNWAKNTLASVKTEEAYGIVQLIFYFSNLIQIFPLGNIATNLEIAITGYQIALNIVTFDVFPQQWAMTQHALASAYRNRIRGDKAENLEKAIAAYTEALKVFTFDAFPKDWATTQNNLAIAYRNRIRGDEADNLEKAIAAYTEALKVFTFDAFPYEWATTQNNLVAAYSDRIRGDKADNLEKAIAVCTEALKVFTFDAFPHEWAITQNNLANAYFNRIRGDRAENLEKAIAVCTEALKVFTFDAFPYEWATTRNNLANAYLNRIRGDKADNLEKAIICYKNALKGYESRGDSFQVAEMALILGKIYVDEGHWYKGLDYLEKSWQKYRLLEDFKGLADVTYQIAHTHHLIGNFEKASVNYRDALRFYEHLGNDRGVAFCKASLGRLILQFAPVEEAKKQLEQAQKIFIDINEQSQVTEIENILQYLKQIKDKQTV